MNVKKDFRELSSSALPLRVPTCNTAPSVPMPPLHAPPGTARAVRPGPKAPYNPSASPCVPASASCRAAPAMAVRGRVGERASRDTAAPQAHFGPRAARTGARRAAHPTRDPKVDPGMCEKPCLLSAACAAGTTEREKPHCQNYLFTAAAGTTDALPGFGRRLGRRRSRLRSHRRRNRSRHSRRPGRATTDAGGTTPNKNSLAYKNPETTTEGRAARGANDARVVRPRACSRLRSHRRRSRRPGRAATTTGDAGTSPNGNLLETTEGQIEIGLCGPRRSSWSPPRRLPRHPRPPPAPRRAPPRAAGTAPTGRHERR